MKELVMGLHWTPRSKSDIAPAADLDALCALMDSRGRLLDVISPQRPRTANDSVVHTGNSFNGANHWDDERIFVFLDALSPDIGRVAFLVKSVSGQSFGEIPGARCHISDARLERTLFAVDLTLFTDQSRQLVCDLLKQDGTWHLRGERGSEIALWREIDRDLTHRPLRDQSARSLGRLIESSGKT